MELKPLAFDFIINLFLNKLLLVKLDCGKFILAL